MDFTLNILTFYLTSNHHSVRFVTTVPLRFEVCKQKG